MPRDSAGNYSLPAGYLAETGQTILASQHNPPLEDIATALTGSLPRNGAAAMQAALPMGGFKVTGLAAGTADTDAVNLSQINSIIPAGVIWEFGGATAPAGFLLCAGQAVSRSTYANLFAAIGTAHGAGDGSTTFNVPDYRGRVGAGKDDMGGTAAGLLTTAGSGISGATLGAAGGSQNCGLGISNLPNLAITITDPGHQHSIPGGPDQSGGGNWSGAGGNPYDSPNGSSTTGMRTTGISASITGTSGTATGAPHANVQPTLIVNKIIKY